MTVRAKDVARIIGVSEATLSLVINGKPGISEKTRSIVTEKLKALGYDQMIKINKEAESDSRNIGFILFKDNGQLLGVNSFFPYILSGIETTARKFGYSLSIINIEKKHIQTEIKYIYESGCSGFIIFATEMKESDLNIFESLNLPFVVFDNEFSMREINCVKVNNRQGTALAVEYLRNLGHKKIGYLSSGLSINSFQERMQCAEWAARLMGADDMQRFIYNIGYPNENAEQGMRMILDKYSLKELPTAFIGDNDLVIAGAMLAIKAKGYRIPEDFSLIGFDDRPICTLMEPKLTTIMIPRQLFGSTSVSQLIRLLNGDDDGSVTVKVNGKLVIRDSVKAI